MENTVADEVEWNIDHASDNSHSIVSGINADHVEIPVNHEQDEKNTVIKYPLSALVRLSNGINDTTNRSFLGIDVENRHQEAPEQESNHNFHDKSGLEHSD